MKVKIILPAIIASAVSVGLIAPNASAAPAGSSEVSQERSTYSLITSRSKSLLTQEDYTVIANNARNHGDLEGAALIENYANMRNNPGTRIHTTNVITTIAKKAVIKIFRWGASRLPAKIRPYAGKIANFLEDLQNWEEGPIIWGLVQLGIPLDVAQQAAWWIVTFLG